MADLDVANVVGGGDLHRELNLPEFYKNLEGYAMQYEPETFSALVIYYESPKAAVMLYTSGKFSLAGAKSKDSAHKVNQLLIEDLEDLLAEPLSNPTFEIRYLVCTGDLGQEIDLRELTTALGLENTEYEPKQFPGLFYRPPDQEWSATIFTSGKVVLNGIANVQELEKGYWSLRNLLVETK